MTNDAHLESAGEPHRLDRRRVLIVGGVAGGASCAARLRRLDESATIVVFDRGPYVSFANCGLPYYVGNVIADERKLLVASSETFRERFNIQVHTETEVTAIDRAARTVTIHELRTGITREEHYDILVLSPGAAPIRPSLPGVDLPGIFAVRSIPDSRRIRAPRAIELDGGGNDVDALLYACGADRLRTEDAAVGYRKQQLEMDRLGPGVVTRVMAWVQVHFLKTGDTGAPESLLAGARGRNGQTQDAHHRCCLNTPEPAGTPGAARLPRPQPVRGLYHVQGPQSGSVGAVSRRTRARI